MRRGELNDEQWERLRPLLPAQKPRCGGPHLEHWQVINGILWTLRTGIIPSTHFYNARRGTADLSRSKPPG